MVDQISRLIDSDRARAIRVGPSSPAICLEFVIVRSRFQPTLTRFVEKDQDARGHSTLPKQLGPSLCEGLANEMTPTLLVVGIILLTSHKPGHSAGGFV